MIKILDMEQRSEEWYVEKVGKPSASNMNKIITATGKPSKQREDYLYTLCAERISGCFTNTYQSPAMIEGIEREAESRQLYELIHGVEVEMVGIIYKDESKSFLCSPDGLINYEYREYGLELKNVLPKTQIAYLLNGKLPSEYFVQVQASMFITGFPMWAFFSYSPGLPVLDLMIYRDDTFCDKLETALLEFCNDLEKTTERIRTL